MRQSRSKPPNFEQLDLLDSEGADAASEASSQHSNAVELSPASVEAGVPLRNARGLATGLPLIVPIDRVYEDPDNPRTEFPESELVALTEDVRLRGILQPIVVHPADAKGRYRIHFGAKRLRAARRAGLQELPVVVRNCPADPYAQVAENLKRCSLTPLDLARFLRSRVDAGETSVEIARKLGMDLTTVGHHLALLTLPPVLEDALQSGRCTSPRTLHELSKLHDNHPEVVEATVATGTDLTRSMVAELKTAAGALRPAKKVVAKAHRGRAVASIDLAEALCGRLEVALRAAASLPADAVRERLEALRQRLVRIATN